MIEQIIKKRLRAFLYGGIKTVDSVEGKAEVDMGSGGAVWIKTSISLKVGDTVILARNEDSSKFIMQASRKAMPQEKILMEV